MGCYSSAMNRAAFNMHLCMLIITSPCCVPASKAGNNLLKQCSIAPTMCASDACKHAKGKG